MSSVLLLNASYEPLNICSWKRAVVLLLKGKAEAVEAHEEKKLGPGYALPLVIRLLYYIKIPHKEMPLNRRNLMHRDQYTCQYCGKKNALTLDHVLPRSRGGKDSWENIVVACVRCNVDKGNRTPQEARMPLLKKPVRPFNFVHFELSKQEKHNVRYYHSWRKYFYESL